MILSYEFFCQPSAKRSKTVIVVKNLPFNTTCDELRTIFAPFGTVARLVLPPSGITALVEFFESSQAKKAFQKLAYSKVICSIEIKIAGKSKTHEHFASQ